MARITFSEKGQHKGPKEIREIDKLKKRLLEICKSCKDGLCCCDGVSLDFTEALKISLLNLDIKKPWFTRFHRDKDLPSGWAVETTTRDGRCVFQKKDRRCSVYKIRGIYCADFPFEHGKLAPTYEYLCSKAQEIKAHSTTVK